MRCITRRRASTCRPRRVRGGFLFFLPLAGVGFHPAAIALMLALGLLYQFFLHTALPVHLGPLEWVLNTPRPHPVHHACNDACLDTNYGSTPTVFAPPSGASP